MILYRPGKWRLEFLSKPTRAPAEDAAAWRQKLPEEDRDNKSIIFDSYSMSPLPLSVGRAS